MSMSHRVQDGIDATQRHQSAYTGQWHPILAAQEREPGVWSMVAQYNREYGTVRFIRRGDELGYRVEDEHGNIIGYYRTLLAATFAAHRNYLSALTPGGAING